MSLSFSSEKCHPEAELGPEHSRPQGPGISSSSGGAGAQRGPQDGR